MINSGVDATRVGDFGTRVVRQVNLSSREPDATAKAIAATKLDTVVGHVAWDGANLPPFAAKNVAKTPLVGGQWRLKEGNKYDIVIVDNKTFPAIPVGGKMEAIQ